VEEIEEKCLYPAKHPFIRTMTDSDDPNKTPYSVTTTSFLLYKKSYMHFIPGANEEPPISFKHNRGNDFIHYPITQPYGETAQAQYVQMIMGPNPIVIGICNNTDKVYSKLLYTKPIYRFDGKPIYTKEELEMLMLEAKENEKTDWMIERVEDKLLAAKVRCFHAVLAKAKRVAGSIQESEKVWGELATAKLGTSANPGNPCRDYRDCRYCRHHSDLVVDL